MLKQFTPVWYKQCLFALSMMAAAALACTNADFFEARDEELSLWDDFDRCYRGLGQILSDPETKARMELCLFDYTPEEIEKIKNTKTCFESKDCLDFFNDFVAVEEPAPAEPEPPQPEEIPAGPQGTLALTNPAATPEDCTAELTEQSLAMTCNFRIQVEATWQSSVTPAYIHCDAGSRGTSTHELTAPSGDKTIEFVASNLEVVHHVERIPDDRFITFSCALSTKAEHRITSGPNTLAQLRCLPPDNFDPDDPTLCPAAIGSWATVWSAP